MTAGTTQPALYRETAFYRDTQIAIHRATSAFATSRAAGAHSRVVFQLAF